MKSSDKILVGIVCICLGTVLLGFAIFTMYGGSAVFMGIYAPGTLVGGALLVADEAKKKKKEELAQEEQRQKEAAEQEEKRRQEEAKRRQEEINKPIKFYNDCEKRNIHSSTTEAEKQGIMLIAKKYGIDDLEEALAFFQQGKDMVMKEEADRQKAAEEAERKEKLKKVNAERSNEAKTIEKQKQTAMLCGVKKYRDAINSKLLSEQETFDNAKEQVDEMEKKGSELNKLEQDTMQMNARAYVQNIMDSSRYAGSVAGIVAEHEAEKSKQRNERLFNAAISAINEQRSKVYEGYSDLKKTMNDSQKCINNLEHQLDELNDKLIDDSDTEKKFELLNFSNFKCSVRETGNIDVTGESTLTQDIFVATVKGWLDGSVKLTVLDESNTPVAVGYFSGRYFPYSSDGHFKINGAFGMTKHTRKSISALCAPIDGKSVSNTDGLTVMVEPVHMWIIED